MPKKLTIELMRELAAEQGGVCLSASYEGILVPLQWQCREGHRWYAIPHSVRQGHWCRYCAAERRRKSIDDLTRLAATRGGQLVAEEYVNSQTKLRWRCAAGHEWHAIANSIRQGTWCPMCDKETTPEPA